MDCNDPQVPTQDRQDTYRPLRDADPDDQHGLNNIRGNGLWNWRPDLTTADCRHLLYDDRGIETRSQVGTGPNLHPAKTGKPAMAIFKLSAANVITSMQIHGKGLRSNLGDVLRVNVSRSAGLQWTSVWEPDSIGPQQFDLTLRDAVAGVTECLVKVEMSAVNQKTDVGLDEIRFTIITQVNRRTLPKLTLGANRIRLHADEQLDSTVLWPVLHGGQYRQTVFNETQVYSADQPDGIYKATLGSAVNGQACQATWRLELPTDIVDIHYGVVATNRSSASFVSLRHSVDGNHFSEFYRKSDGAFPFDQQVLHRVPDTQIPPGTQQTYLQCAFFCRGGAATYGMDGIQDLFIRVQHRPRDAHFQPIEVTYNWTEHRESGDVTRLHTERVPSLPHSYVINTAGFRDPTMNWVRMHLAGNRPDSEARIQGYSDGRDVGPACEYQKVVYQWDRNLAFGTAYTASRPSSHVSGNPDTDSRELTNGKIIAPTDDTTPKAIQAATAFWDTGDPVAFVVDLGQQQTLAGVRVSTHQPNATTCHPDRVEVTVSVDGTTWQPAGTIRHHDLWKPPGDYEPWEHDDDPDYAPLPAGGRLAYSFPGVFDRPRLGRYVRFSCTPLPDRAMGISELEVFDRVEVTPWPTAP